MQRRLAAGRSPARPGAVLKSVRIQRGWTLAEVSERTGFPISTLSKMENDRVSLTYDKLTRISAGLEIDIARLFGAGADAANTGDSSGRRSIIRAGEGRTIDSKNYLHLYPAAELLNKSLIPIIVEHRARTLEEFGPLVRHSGEEYVYVLEGEIEVCTSQYAPVRLKAGDSIYLDSRMGHAYLAVGSGPCRTLAVCSGPESQMIEAVGGEAPGGGRPASAAAPVAAVPQRPRPRRRRKI
jgi:transcriptional regulator with XRE-family HTH domain